jgi:hypothetical protein
MTTQIHDLSNTWPLKYMTSQIRQVFERSGIWVVMYLSGHVFERSCIWEVMYLSGHVFEWSCIWVVRYLSGQVFEWSCIWVVMYLSGHVFQIHDLSNTWPLKYMTAQIHDHSNTWPLKYMTTQIHDHSNTWPLKYMTSLEWSCILEVMYLRGHVFERSCIWVVMYLSGHVFELSYIWVIMSRRVMGIKILNSCRWSGGNKTPGVNLVITRFHKILLITLRLMAPAHESETIVFNFRKLLSTLPNYAELEQILLFSVNWGKQVW